LGFYPLFIQRLADDVIDRLKEYSQPLRVSLELKRYTRWLRSDDLSPRSPGEVMKDLIEDERKDTKHDRRKPLLHLHDLLKNYDFDLKCLYECLAEPDHRSDFRPRLMDRLLSRPGLLEELVNATNAAVPFTLLLKRELESVAARR